MAFHQLPHFQVKGGICIYRVTDVSASTELVTAYRLVTVVNDGKDGDQVAHGFEILALWHAPLDRYHVLEILHLEKGLGQDIAIGPPIGIVNDDPNINRARDGLIVAQDIVLGGVVEDGRSDLQTDSAEVLSAPGIFDGANGVLVLDAAHDGGLALRGLYDRAQERSPFLIPQLGTFSHSRGHFKHGLSCNQTAFNQKFCKSRHLAEIHLKILVEGCG